MLNLVKKGDKVIIPVNGEFSNRLSQQIEGQGANVVKLETPPGQNATFDQVKEAFDNNKDVKGILCVFGMKLQQEPWLIILIESKILHQEMILLCFRWCINCWW